MRFIRAKKGVRSQSYPGRVVVRQPYASGICHRLELAITVLPRPRLCLFQLALENTLKQQIRRYAVWLCLPVTKFPICLAIRVS